VLTIEHYVRQNADCYLSNWISCCSNTKWQITSQVYKHEDDDGITALDRVKMHISVKKIYQL